MTRRKKIIIAAALVLGAAAWLLLHRGPRDRKRGEMRPAVVRQGVLEDTVDATGSVSPLNRVEVKPPISGRMEKLLADEGDSVRAGQIIAWMSSTDRAAILDAARAQGPDQLKKWEDAYKPTPIVAPLSGVVILRNVVVGQTVDPGTVLFAMSDTLIVLAQVDESDIGRVKNGMPARVVLDAYPDKAAEGKVVDILYEGKNVSNVITYGVKIRLDKTPPFFRSQMTANVSFIAARKENALLLPTAALKEGADGSKQVLVPGPDGKPVPKVVEIGLSSGPDVEILSGLSAGDKVLIRQTRYVPQEGPQASPLAGGGRPSASGNPNGGQGQGRRRSSP